MAAEQILFIYAVGLIMFIFSIEEKSELFETKVLYICLSLFVNTMGYYLSYGDTNYVSLAYFPLFLVVITSLLMIVIGFKFIKEISSTDYKEKGD